MSKVEDSGNWGIKKCIDQLYLAKFTLVGKAHIKRIPHSSAPMWKKWKVLSQLPAEVHQIDKGGEVFDLIGEQVSSGVGRGQDVGCIIWSLVNTEISGR